MRRHRFLPSLVLLIVAAGCARPAESPSMPALDPAAMRDTVQAREQEWSAAFLAANAAGVAAMYTEDGAQVEPAGEWRRGRDAIAMGMQAQFDTLNVTSREDVPEEVIVAGDYVLEIGHYSYTGTSKVGNQPRSGAGRYMVLWRKDADGVWRIHRDIGNEAPPQK